MRLANVWNLGIKELRGLLRDPILLILIVYAVVWPFKTVAKLLKRK
mgnify:CR=1 FL=1